MRIPVASLVGLALTCGLIGTAACRSSEETPGGGAAAAERCPECVAAISASRTYWKQLFDESLGDQPMEPGAYANLQTVAKLHPPFAAFLAGELGEANRPRGNWARLVWRRFGGLPDLEVYPDPRIRHFTRTLYCDRYPRYADADFREFLAIADGRGGYFDTHLLMGLLLLEVNGCRGSAEIAGHVDEVARRILAAQQRSLGYDDLFVERVTFLHWAGMGDRIEPGWIDTILAHQNPDGGWGLTPGQPSHPHPTSLAILGLAYHADGAARQPVTYPVLAD